MAVKEPQSMDELVYFTKRAIGEGSATAWVYRGKCPKCKKGLMSKPINPKTGKVKIRAKEYVCSECGHIEEKEEFEKTLTVEVKYLCPHCKADGDATAPFVRKKVSRKDPDSGKRTVVEVIRVSCSKCAGNIDITKKMK